MIKISEAAQNEIRRMQKSQEQENSYLRLDVKEGGCSGLYYTFSWEKESQGSDRVYPQNDFSVVIDEKSLPYLNQLTLDFTEDLMGGGFRFQNPQATQSCSCGISFTLD
ncbi:iron-sulfur cluster assembly accessory protein [Euhalothece natronophila Z-M001]|uniref:Iron-sulfur cluster assembly accessory protein n=1 Tax=Euhalothece natronophila Z-M001 TaxID=522448 RepID=A0A5B8NNN4_9CHRO|nr:iron-sulfur cluster assembly accessory protein [Euhalothece natronophila]QDZ40546.1 iron-sulfur cluster assembly accessory protein [Euhalothece natronophila Z-M001]